MNPTPMTPEQAVEEAIGYEQRIRDLYREAADKAVDPTGRKVFGMLADDEQRHVEYLEHRLGQLRSNAELTLDEVPTAIPDSKFFQRLEGRIEKELDREDRNDEKQMLSKALQVEIETSEFYRRMAEQMTGDVADMFERFLKIEDGHIVAVQAELDYLSGTGFWFDFQEFDMEH
ncbi:MAG: ferritin family protein [Desulfobacterales bacterium]